MLTSRFHRLVIGFTDKFFIVHQIKLVAGVELTATHRAGEAFEVIDVILCSTDYLCRWDALLAARTLRSITPRHAYTTINKHTCYFCTHVQSSVTSSGELNLKIVISTPHHLSAVPYSCHARIRRSYTTRPSPTLQRNPPNDTLLGKC